MAEGAVAAGRMVPDGPGVEEGGKEVEDYGFRCWVVRSRISVEVRDWSSYRSSCSCVLALQQAVQTPKTKTIKLAMNSANTDYK